MEERGPHSSDEVRILALESPKPNYDDNNNDPRPSATYVVQVPKDQIYRVPPPENAAIAERRRNEPANKNSSSSSSSTSRSGAGAAWCCCSLFILVALILFFALAAGLLTSALRPKLPAFVIEQVAAIEDQMYQILARSDNPNARLDISYDAKRRGGEVALWLGKSQVAAGKFPAYFHAHGSSTEVEILLHRRNSSSMTMPKGKAKVSLKMSDLEARTEVWTWNTGTLQFDVACDVTVDSLTHKNTTTSHVLTQNCRSNNRG